MACTKNILKIKRPNTSYKNERFIKSESQHYQYHINHKANSEHRHESYIA